MNDHSPGPWRVSTGASRVVIREGGGTIAIAEYRSDNTAYKNARLIAAAPDMLSLIHRIYDRGYGIDEHKLVRAVIAKATGVEPND